MNILAASGAWTLDVVFFALLGLGLLIGVIRGFVKGICKIAGTVFSVVFAFAFCVPMKNQLDTWFGLTAALGGTTLSGWLAIVISYIALVVLIKLGAWIVGKIGSALVGKFAPIKVVDRILGGILGAAKALLFILLLLALFKWIGIAEVDAFIYETSVVKHIYFSEWFMRAFNLPV